VSVVASFRVSDINQSLLVMGWNGTASLPTTWDLQVLRSGQKPIALPGEIKERMPAKVTRAESKLAKRKTRSLFRYEGATDVSVRNSRAAIPIWYQKGQHQKHP